MVVIGVDLASEAVHGALDVVDEELDLSKGLVVQLLVLECV